MTPPSSPADRDPRDTLPVAAERDIRPLVKRPGRGLSGAAIGGIAVAAALALFGVLEARRQAPSAPATTLDAGGMTSGGSASRPPLALPPLPSPAYEPSSSIPMGSPVGDLPLPTPPSRIVTQPQTPLATAAPSYEPPVSSQPSSSLPTGSPVRQAPPRTVSGQSLVLDSSTPITTGNDDKPAEDDAKDPGKRASLSTTRARAAMFANRATTVPQGTLIPAVLETAFDSTSPGFARALVQKDVRGFDGTRVLIPRGSRLIGEYGADTAQGQKRAVILWARLIRPDGVTIAIGSPAADTVGRGGVKADVNSHFLERFSGAILQSAFDLGITLAARSSRSPVVVALPGTGSRVASTVPAATGADIAPTLRVPAGHSVSVFVARDLDFTEAEGVR